MSSWGVGAIEKDGVDGLEGPTPDEEGVIGNCGGGLEKDSGTDDACTGVNTGIQEVDKFLETTVEDEGVVGISGVGLDIVCTGDEESINSCTGEYTSSARIVGIAGSGDDTGRLSDINVVTFDFLSDIGESSLGIGTSGGS